MNATRTTRTTRAATKTAAATKKAAAPAKKTPRTAAKPKQPAAEAAVKRPRAVKTATTAKTVKAPVKKAVKVANKPVPKALKAEKPAKPVKAAKAPKAAKPVAVAPVPAPVEAKVKRSKKEKVVRDSFTMPKSDYDKIAALKQKCLDAGVVVKKSELLRAGLGLLESVPANQLLAAIAAVETVKTGRPARS